MTIELRSGQFGTDMSTCITAEMRDLRTVYATSAFAGFPARKQERQ